MLIASCGFAAAVDNDAGDSLGLDSSNSDSLSASSSDADQGSDDSSTDSSSDSDDEDDTVNAEIDVDIIYDRNESAGSSEDVPSENSNVIDLTVHPTANPLILGLIAIMGIFLPLRGRI